MVILFIFIFCNFFACSSPSGPPDVVFVSIDSLRADGLSSYGNKRLTSPFIDQLAANGTRFSRARSSSPWTLPSHVTMFTGKLPTTHRVVEDNLKLGKDSPVLAEILQKSGWKTGAFVSTLYVSRLFGFQRGFDHFDDFNIHTERKNLRGEVRASMVVDRAIDWWRKQNKDDRVFLFLHFYDVHYPYAPPEPYGSIFDRLPSKSDPRYRNYFYFKKNPLTPDQFTHKRAQYDECIRYVDDQLRRISAYADSAGKNLRWVVTSDHGEEFGERGSWGHAHTLYSEQLHVPLIFSGPGIPAGTVDTGWAGTHDIAATVLGWEGLQIPADGIDLNPHMSGVALPERPMTAETSRFKTNRISLLSGDRRLEWNLKAGVSELFDPVADPSERKNLASEEPEREQKLQYELEKLIGPQWRSNKDGQLVFKNAFVLKNGLGRSPLDIKRGEEFSFLPLDAKFYYRSEGESVRSGPFSATHGHESAEKDIKFLGNYSTDRTGLTEKNRKLLESLGYIQSME